MNNAAILPDRAVIRLAGDDRRHFLQGLITQDIDALAPGRPIFAALLTPQGKILLDFFIIEAGETFLIDVARAAAPDLARRLAMYKLRAKVAIEIDEGLGVAASAEEISGPRAFRDPRLAAMGWRAVVPAGDDATGANDYDGRRLALGVPECGKDYGPDEMFLLDVNYDALNAVSYKKGCFVGQEVTSRMKRKGEVRRRTLIAQFDGAAPAPGSAVAAGDSTLGETLSGADGKALALIRLDRWEKAKAAGNAPTAEDRDMQLAIPAYLEQG